MRSKPYKRSGKPNAKYYIDFYTYSNGQAKRVSRSTGTQDYQIACNILKCKQSDAAKAKFSLVDPLTEKFKAESTRPIWDHIEEYIEEIAANGATAHHIAVTRSGLCRFAKFSGRKSWSEVDDEDAVRFVSHLRESGLSSGTCNNYRRMLKALSRRMYETRKSPTDILVALKKSRSRQRVIRRSVLSRDEFCVLIKNLSGSWRRTTPADRKIAYCLATRCGLRAGEVTQLSESSFSLDVKSPFLFLREDQTKNRKAAKLFLGDKLANQVRGYFADGNTLSSLPHKHNLQKMLRHDLRASGIPATRQSGERIDFHALRHTCGFWLVSEGVNIKTVQSIMRHSSITMTLDTYGHLLEGAEGAAIDNTEHLLPI